MRPNICKSNIHTQLLLYLIIFSSILTLSFACVAAASPNIESDEELIESAIPITATKDPEPINITPMSANAYFEVKALGARYQNSKAFIRYLTESWAKADNYNWSVSQSVGLTFTTSISIDAAKAIQAEFGLESGYTASYSVGISIPADSSRFSKLALRMDLMQQYVQFQRTVYSCVAGVCSQFKDPWVNTTYVEPTKNTYLTVEYQR